MAAALALLAVADRTAQAQPPVQAPPQAQAAGAAEPYGPGCQVVRRASIPLFHSNGRFSTPVAIDDAVTPMMIDTGSQRGGLSPRAAARIGLRPNERAVFSAQGIGGRTTGAHPYIARGIRFGPATWAQYNLQPVDITRPGDAGDPNAPEGLIGADMLSGYDVEFDFPGRTITLYSVTGCTGAFAPWTTRFDTLASEGAPAELFVIPVTIDGHKVRALLDTGSNASSMAQQAAERLGVGREALGRDPAGAYVGARGVPVASHLHRFETLSFGAFNFRNAPISVQDANFGFADMLLGMDFLGPRRLWLSYRTHQVFIQVPRITAAPPTARPAPPAPRAPARPAPI